jgi:hypothetical protein
MKRLGVVLLFVCLALLPACEDKPPVGTIWELTGHCDWRKPPIGECASIIVHGDTLLFPHCSEINFRSGDARNVYTTSTETGTEPQVRPGGVVACKIWPDLLHAGNPHGIPAIGHGPRATVVQDSMRR